MASRKLIYASDARRAILKEDPKLAYCIDDIPAVDAVEIPDCKKCVFFHTIAWHQCEGCIGDARNNFAEREESNDGK